MRLNNQIDMPRHQRGKRLVGIIFRILPQQRAVVRWLHSVVSVRRADKTDNLFADLSAGDFSAHATDNALAVGRIHKTHNISGIGAV